MIFISSSTKCLINKKINWEGSERHRESQTDTERHWHRQTERQTDIKNKKQKIITESQFLVFSFWFCTFRSELSWKQNLQYKTVLFNFFVLGLGFFVISFPHYFSQSKVFYCFQWTHHKINTWNWHIKMEQATLQHRMKSKQSTLSISWKKVREKGLGSVWNWAF